jgi:FkbM family methyltransferase
MNNKTGTWLRRAKRKLFPKCSFPHAFSQEGEDMILARVFEHRTTGFYVDVGAHHPVRFSNTYYFYLKGWRGINIDAMPGSMTAFMEGRPNDINIETGVAEKSGNLNFHIFNEPALNTFDPVIAKERDGVGNYRIVEVREVKIQPLSQILEEHLPAGVSIDFMSVDVEGLDLAVMRSNNWKKFRPEYVLAEDFKGDTVEEALKSELAAFLRAADYVLFAKTAHTLIFKRMDNAVKKTI